MQSIITSSHIYLHTYRSFATVTMKRKNCHFLVICKKQQEHKEKRIKYNLKVHTFSPLQLKFQI